MTNLQRKSLQGLVAGCATLAILTVLPTLSHAKGHKTKMKSALSATSADPNASGQAGFVLGGSDGKLDVKASHLTRSASFDVIVNGVKVGSLQTTKGGSGRQRFRSDPKKRELKLGFDPRGAQLSVRDGAGHDVLVGTMPASADPTAIACCVPAADGTSTCQEITADECTAATGVANAAAGCLPDPCVTTPPPAAVVCCLNETDDDESETECADKSEADCAALGGMSVQADSCEADPCAPVTPPAGDVAACCLTHENETECEGRTTEACTARGGTVMAGATCATDPCGIGGGSGGGDDDGGDDGEDHDGGGDHSGGDD